MDRAPGVASTLKNVTAEDPLSPLLDFWYYNELSLRWSALFNICRKALGHLTKFTQCSIPYRFGLGLSTAFYRLGLSTAFYRLGLSTVSKLVRSFCWVGVDAMCTLILC